MSDKTRLELDLEKIKKRSHKKPAQDKHFKDLPLIILIIVMLAGWYMFIVEHVNHNATKNLLTAITAKYEAQHSQPDNTTLNKEHTPAKKVH
ncbi:MAG: hypothetical protein HQK99_05570 [Nitrospirae bacterium]|nr:hypothetical protein [Nitrospirota bacterium]